MLRTVLVHLRAQWMGALALFLVIAGGTAYAANTVFSADIVNGQVKSPDIGTGQVQSIDVKDDGLTGADISEPTLQNVNASTVSGLQVRKINFQAPPGTGPTTVLTLAGLQITAECQAFGDFLDVKAFTSKNGASVFYLGGFTQGADDTDTVQDIASNQVADGGFNVGQQLQIDDASPSGGNNVVGTLNYSAPDGSVVVVRLALDEIRGGGAFHGCALTGVAIGG